MNIINKLPRIPEESKNNYNFFIVFRCKDNKKRFTLFILRERPHAVVNVDNIIEYIDYNGESIRSIHYTCLEDDLYWKERLICPSTKLSKDLLENTNIISNFDLLICVEAKPLQH